MYKSLSVLIFILYVAIPITDGATCASYSTCQATDYTLSACTSGTCNCLNSSFVPIRSGCALKLAKPVIITASRKSNQVLAGATFTLYCRVADSSDNYEWFLDNTKLPTLYNDHTDTASAATVGTFTCRAFGQHPSIMSDLSDPFKMEMLGEDGITTTSVQPVISLPPVVFAGSTLNIVCTNVPFGIFERKYTVNGVENTNNIVVIDASNAGKDVTCSIKTIPAGLTFTKPSVVAKLPTLITNIQSVSVRIDDVTVTEVIVEDSTTIHLKCSESPERAWLGTYSSITYTWQRNSSPLSETGETLSLTTSGTYSCSVKLDSKVAVTSNTVQVTVSSTPLVTTTATNPVKGSRVILTCGLKRGDGVVYTWSKDSVVIYRQFDRKLHLDNVDTADSGTYYCSAFHNGLFYSGSRTFNVQETSTAECGLDKNCTKIGFVCDNTVCKCASGHFQDDGSCVAIDAKTNTTICASDKDCTLTGFKCYNKLCVCASGNLPIKGECSAVNKNGVVQVVSSVVLIMLTCIILKFI